MKLTKRGEYALRALIGLGIARESGAPIVRIRDLAEKENIPVKFLEAILIELKTAGFLESKRGKQGGYSLAKPADRISIGDVIRKIEGPLAPIACVSQTCYERCSCPDEAHCGLRMVMLEVRNAVARILDAYTLKQTVDAMMRKMREDSVSIPFLSGTEARDSKPLGELAPK
ncbi:MAG: Rrf2 family transcriptional regulator [Verrucomicrobia bacterium]|nr:Rrf2 family transcriptional regulator [Verrucomicrobiota bacterium]